MKLTEGDWKFLLKQCYVEAKYPIFNIYTDFYLKIQRCASNIGMDNKEGSQTPSPMNLSGAIWSDNIFSLTSRA